jgi:hypothetical protein
LSPDAVVAPPVTVGASASCYLPSPRFASRLPSSVGRKMLLADFCNRLSTRAPVDRPTPERAACAVPIATAARGEPSAFATPYRRCRRSSPR